MLISSSLHVVVASTNPTKIQAARGGLSAMFPDKTLTLTGVSVPSGVPDQPVGDDETLTGARNRVMAARAAHPDADVWIGIEGGIAPRGETLDAFAWVCVMGKTGYGTARSAAFELPRAVRALTDAGLELGSAMDQLFQAVNSKHHQGAVGLLTGDVITREQLYQPAVVLALIPFRHPDLYPA
ncbi:MAG: inosine/xanthosine triphosphatase [Bacteroidia bacterium]|nr:inosine/xanthosine triphosphatase [Bacteroidia bacterium]